MALNFISNVIFVNLTFADVRQGFVLAVIAPTVPSHEPVTFEHLLGALGGFGDVVSKEVSTSDVAVFARSAGSTAPVFVIDLEQPVIIGTVLILPTLPSCVATTLVLH